MVKFYMHWDFALPQALSLNTQYFKVSFSGLGSNKVANGTKSLYP